MIRTIFLCMSAALLISCAHSRLEFKGSRATSASNEKGDKSLTITPVWIKYKKDTIDILADIRNSYDYPIIAKQSSVVLKYAGGKYGLRNNSDISMQTGPGVSRRALMIFDILQAPPSDNATLVIETINSEDGKLLPPLSIELPVPLKTSARQSKNK